MQAGGTHVAFSAPSKAAVHNFFACALKAGAIPHGNPANRYDGDDCFNAAVLDFDGNSIEVVYHEIVHVGGAPSVAGSSHSRVLAWAENVSASDAQSVASTRSAARSVVSTKSAAKSVVSAKSITSAAQSAAQRAMTVHSKAGSVIGVPAEAMNAPSEVSAQSVLTTLQKSITSPHSSAVASLLSNSKVEMTTKTLAGTLLGAAAGAAVAYAMCKSEEDSARQEEEASLAAARMYRAQQPQIAYPRTPSNTPAGSHYTASQAGARAPLLLEAPPLPPLSNYTGSPLSLTRAIEYLPSRAPSQVSSARRPTKSVEERFAELDLHSVHGSKAPSVKAPSAKASSHAGSKTSKRASSKAASEAPTPASKAPTEKSRSRSASRARSEASRHSSHSHSSRKSHRSHSSRHKGAESLSGSAYLGIVVEEGSDSEPPADHAAFLGEQDDVETVAPSDSISCAGSSRRRKKRRGSKSEGKKESRKEGSRDRRKKDSSESGSEATVTQKKYSAKERDRSVASLPVRGLGRMESARTIASFCG